jgi:hypothetical protein
MNTVEVVYDGRAFVPTSSVNVPKGTKCTVMLEEVAAIIRPSMGVPEAERILNGDGEQLPWATVEEALGHPRYQA